jgi:hypothetical protein
MNRVVFSLAAVGFLAGSVSWLVGARGGPHPAMVG